MSLKSLTEELRDAADRCRQIGESNEKRAQGVEYALDFVEQYIGILRLEERKMQEMSQRTPVDASDNEECIYESGVAGGLGVALQILAEEEDPKDTDCPERDEQCDPTCTVWASGDHRCGTR